MQVSSSLLASRGGDRAFGGLRWWARAQAAYLIAIALSAVAIGIYHSLSGGFGAVAEVAFTLALALPAGLIASTATLLGLRWALPRLRPTRARRKALLLSWTAHLALIAVLSQPWTSSFEPTVAALFLGLTSVGPAATALGVVVGLPRQTAAGHQPC